MNVLVTGISGYVGSALAPRLLADGHHVRGFSRDPDRVAVAGAEVVRGDALTGAGLDEALDGIEVAYYLIHAMEGVAADAPSFAERERLATERFVAAAKAAGVRRIVYLGGLVPGDRAPSPHLASRLAVEEAILRGLPDSVALRASIVIGARSRSFRFLVRLVERLPVLALPAWHSRRTQPVDGRDVLEYLTRSASEPAASGRSLDLAGPDVVTYGEMIEQIRDLMLLSRPSLRLSRITMTAIASPVAAAIAGEDPGLIGPLMGSLESDLLPRDDCARELFGIRTHSFAAAVERSLRDWEASEPLRAR